MDVSFSERCSQSQKQPNHDKKNGRQSLREQYDYNDSDPSSDEDSGNDRKHRRHNKKMSMMIQIRVRNEKQNIIIESQDTRDG